MSNINNTTTSSNDNNQPTLAQLVAAEKLLNNNDMDSVYARNIIRLGSHYEGTELGKSSRSGLDETDEIDMSMFVDNKTSSNHETDTTNKSNKNKNNNDNINSIQQEQYQKQLLQKEVVKAVKQHSYMEQITSNCPQCSSRHLKPLTSYPSNNNNTNNNKSASQQQGICISKSNHVCLQYKPSKLKINNDHFELIPYTSHFPSYLHCDEDCQKEIDRYKNCLNYMYQRQDKFVLNIECSHYYHTNHYNSNNNNNNQNKIKFHTYIDMIGFPNTMQDEIIMFFREAFLSISHQGRLVELTLKRGLKKAVPVGFKYMMVEWGERISTSNSHKQKNNDASSSHNNNGNNNNNINQSGIGRKKSSAVSSECIGYVFIFDRENENEVTEGGQGDGSGVNGEGDHNNTSKNNFLNENDSSDCINADFCLDVLAGMLEEDSYRIRRRIKYHNVNYEEEKKNFNELIENWSMYDWTQYEV